MTRARRVSWRNSSEYCFNMQTPTSLRESLTNHAVSILKGPLVWGSGLHWSAAQFAEFPMPTNFGIRAFLCTNLRLFFSLLPRL